MYEKIGGALQDAYAEAPTLRPREPTNLGDRSALTSASTLALTSTLTPGWCSCWSCWCWCWCWCWLSTMVLVVGSGADAVDAANALPQLDTPTMLVPPQLLQAARC